MSAILGRRLGFGSGGIVGHLSTPEVVDLAQSADELGFDLFTLSDHLHSERETLEPWTALSWIAARTSRIEVGTNVLGLPYRDPPVLAKMAETLDRLSAGRLVLGLGAGGYDHEFEAFGLTVRTAPEKITAQYEALDILRGLWTRETTTYHGEQFRTSEARISPRAAHPIPIWLGSYGPRALRLTGERADGWLPSFGRITLEQATRMRAQVVAAARDAGRDPGEITCACNIAVRVDARGEPRPGLVTGPVESVVEQVLEVVGAGFTFLLIHSLTVDEQEVLARDVFPQVRTLAEERGLVGAGGGTD
ncbi:LLM class flavin-dependent oxidoreductase [Pseudonocardia tropica]|uniref:LLM class flavin-dependent oxidoreductase n=1 Tax=Pseudonocardia tropica TaxID=681289 RepID=A0ABV1JYH8_9PSEU